MIRNLLQTRVCLLACLLAGVASAQSTPLDIEKAGAIEIARIDGDPVRPLDKPEGSIVVIIFGSVDCPVANAGIPEIRRIHDDAKSAGAAMYFVHPSVQQSAEKMRAHARDRRLAMPILHDPERRLVGLLGATTTPEAFVLRRDGDGWVAVYRGLIDDLYADVGRRRRNATAHYVRDAIKAARSRTPLTTPVRTPIGCLIERGGRS